MLRKICTIFVVLMLSSSLAFAADWNQDAQSTFADKVSNESPSAAVTWALSEGFSPAQILKGGVDAGLNDQQLQDIVYAMYVADISGEVIQAAAEEAGIDMTIVNAASAQFIESGGTPSTSTGSVDPPESESVSPYTF
ncbi:hypothetical protein JWG39_05940 [Desulforhopalus vacuolatus]|uniref:hypothetical protein n=1 Tax=Desulforhopalus vacuolatus TaxID=40414 RepID=UPI001966CD4D|nr:hypothetical protein [Desulforhopalus vacuolatus]MBM9519363.1 hypothetical protein [Desulforhopalus vacuolatus]